MNDKKEDFKESQKYYEEINVGNFYKCFHFDDFKHLNVENYFTALNKKVIKILEKEDTKKWNVLDLGCGNY